MVGMSKIGKLIFYINASVIIIDGISYEYQYTTPPPQKKNKTKYTRKILCEGGGSNSRPLDYESTAYPLDHRVVSIWFDK